MAHGIIAMVVPGKYTVYPEEEAIEPPGFEDCAVSQFMNRQAKKAHDCRVQEEGNGKAKPKPLREEEVGQCAGATEKKNVP